MIVDKLVKEGVAHPPSWLPANTHYLTQMGSEAYGCSSNDSDVDVYGFCMPPKDMVFPHLMGEIPGFGTQLKRFEQWQEHHMRSSNKREYDLSIYSIVKYFQLCMECNPNMVDSLFTANRCVMHRTPVADMVRTERRLFLSKKALHTFKGYAFASINKIRRVNSTSLQLIAFMQKLSIPSETTIDDVLREIERRKLETW